MTAEEFIQVLLKYLGQLVESEDPTALDQCMDWAFKGCDILGIDRSAIRHQYAYQVWKEPNDQTVAQFEFIPNTLFGIPQAGDFVVFDQNVVGVTGSAGHICIAKGEGDSGTFKSLDQNWNSVTHVTEETHSYAGVLGWLRPRLFTQQILDQMRADRDRNWNLYQDATTKLGNTIVELQKCQASTPSPTVPTPGPIENPAPVPPGVPNPTPVPPIPPVQPVPPVGIPPQPPQENMNILYRFWQWLIDHVFVGRK